MMLANMPGPAHSRKEQECRDMGKRSRDNQSSDKLWVGKQMLYVQIKGQ